MLEDPPRLPPQGRRRPLCAARHRAPAQPRPRWIGEQFVPDRNSLTTKSKITYGTAFSDHLEGQPIHRQTVAYEIHDAALGLLGRGHVTVRDMVTRQAGPSDGPVCPVCGAVSRHVLPSAPGVPPTGSAS
ncbi:DUF3556 domain-containing protein [Streptomyces sp. NPDC007157]|uniref:DUF3556 domain-containing protein n=1 Tax=Streptomyces sp. NPDC007157 TaxID=3154681 RepID=UPI0033F5FE70